MTTDVVRIVNDIASSPTTRLDLNDGTTWITLFDGTDLTPPKLQRAVTSNLMVDGGWVSASAYPDRVVKLSLECLASTVDAAALEVQKLARELDRADGENYLQWQPAGATHPVFFVLYRSDFDAIREVPGSRKYRRFQVSLLAKPFALGLREDLGSKTISLNPADGTNPLYTDLTGIKGDVPAPLVAVSDDADLHLQIVMTAVRSRGTPSNMTWSVQAETLTAGTDTATATDADASNGGSNNCLSCTFGTATMATRASTSNFPTSGTPNVDFWGTYRLIARLKTSSSSTIRVRARLGPSIYNDEVTLSTTAGWQTYDLGIVQLPTNSPSPRRWGHGNQELVPAAAAFALQAARDSGSGNLLIDWIALVPADEALAVVSIPSLTGSRKVWLDGVNRSVFVTNSLDRPVDPGGRAYYDGRLPHVDPRATTNRVWIVNAFQDGVLYAGTPAYNSAAAWTFYYWPRYLYVRPAST